MTSRERDEAARRYRPYAVRVAVRYCRRTGRGWLADEAESVAHAALWDVLRSDDGSDPSPLAWRIAARVRADCANLARRLRRRPAGPLVGDAPTRDDDPDERIDLRDRARRLLDHADDSARPWLARVYLDGLTCAEAARRGGKSHSTVKEHVRRGLGQIRAATHAEPPPRPGRLTDAQADRLRAALARSGLDARSASRRAGLSRDALSEILSRRRPPVGPEALVALCRALGVPSERVLHDPR